MPPQVTQSQTLSEYLATTLPGSSPRSRQRLIKFGRVTINGRPAASIDEPLSAGDTVEIHPPTPPADAPRADAPAAAPDRPAPRPRRADQDRPARPDRPRAARGRREQAPRRSRLPAGVRILHEDDDLIVVEKPAGLLTASPTPVHDRTLLDILKDHVRSSRTPPRRTGRGPRPAGPRLGVIHRLDRDASGLLVFSKSDRAYESLKEQFRSKRVHRLYLALTEGHVGPRDATGTVQSFLKELPGGKVVSIPTDEYRGAGRGDADAAKLAVTHYRVLGAGSLGGNPYTLLQVRLETGRKNQIRVHLADRGHPIAGDRRYGARTDPGRRLCLHAAELGFTHPATGQSLRFSSPAPENFYRAAGLPPPPPPPTSAPAPAPPAPLPRGAAAETSWDDVAEWYDQLLEGRDQGDQDRGSDHYENTILPGALRLLAPTAGMKVLDVACGQGILARRLAALGVHVTGVEASEGLVAAARRRSADSPTPITYHVGDARDLAALNLPRDFDAAACIMALTNIDPLEPAIRSIADHLRPGGVFVAVLSHPAFRVPQQTSWGWDPSGGGRQYRRIDGYLSPGQYRIAMHPGADPSITTWTFHRPLQTYVHTIVSCGMHITALEEWPGHRTSTSGPRAAEENRARREIPLFLALRAVKV